MEMSPEMRKGLSYFLIVALTLAVGAHAAEPPPTPGRLDTAANFKLGSATGDEVSATDWPRWRGPHADGVADDRELPLNWSRTENIRWSVELPGWLIYRTDSHLYCIAEANRDR